MAVVLSATTALLVVPAQASSREKVLPSYPMGWLVATTGQLFSVSSSSTHPVELRTIRTSPGGSSISYGAGRKYFDLRGALRLFARGGKTVTISNGAKQADPNRIVVRDGSRIIRRYLSDTMTIVAMPSGRRLLLTWGPPDPTTEPWGGGSKVLDMQTGRTTARLPPAPSIDGDLVAYPRQGGEIRVRDLVTGHDRQIRKPGGGYTDSAFRMVLLVSGSWLVYVLPNPDGTVLDAAAVNLHSGKRIPLHGHIAAYNGDSTAVSLADGLLAWIDHDDARVHVLRLSDNTDHIVGTSKTGREGTPAFWITLTDEFVAWVGSDRRRHVRALPVSWADAPPRGLGVMAPASFTPNRDGSNDTYNVAVDVTRPLTSWTLTLKNSSGTAVRRLTGSATNGAIRATWNGRDSNGRLLAKGTYDWTLTGSGPSGHLRQRGRTMIGSVKIA